MQEKSYNERLQKLKLWTLEDRRNRQNLLEVFKICKGFSRTRLNETFHFDDRGKGTRGHSLKLVIKGGTSWTRRAVDAASINAFKSKLDRFRCTRMGFFMDQSAEQEASLWNHCGLRKVSN